MLTSRRAMLLAVLVVGAWPVPAPAESLVGREFWVAWPATPDVTGSDPDYDLDAELVLVAATDPLDVRVTGPGLDLIVSVAPGLPGSVRLDRALVMADVEHVPLDRGVHLESLSCSTFGALLRVPGARASVGDDVARLLPVETLGTRYLPVAYTGEAGFAVVATQDGTTVSFDDPHCARPASVVLDRGQVVAHACHGSAGDGDVSGIVVESSAPVAVVSTSSSKVVLYSTPTMQVFWDWTDVLLEGLWPVGLLGREAAHAPFRHEDPDASGDFVRLVGACAASVAVDEEDGDRWSAALGGEGAVEDLAETLGLTRRLHLVDSGAHFRADAPFQAIACTVGHADAGIGDPSMLVLDPRERWEREAIAWVPDGYSSSIGVVTGAAATATVTLDGAPWPGTWRPLGDGTELAWSRIDDVVAGDRRVAAAEPVFVEVSGYGVPGSALFAGAYSHPGIPLEPGGDPTLHVTGPAPCADSCAGDCVVLQAPAGQPSYRWSTGETSASIVTCPNAPVTVSVEVATSSGCVLRGQRRLEVVGPPAPLAIDGPDGACPGECVDLVATPGFDAYAWSTGDAGPTLTVCPAADQLLTLEAIDAFGCVHAAEHALRVARPPVAGPATVRALDPCTRGLLVEWVPATWPPGSPDGVYDLYRREGGCAAPDDPSWQLIAIGLTGLAHHDRGARAGTAYSYLVQAEAVPDGAACRPGPFAGGSTDASCAVPEAAVDPGDPDAGRLVSLSPWLRAAGYERVPPDGPATAVTFTWALAPARDPLTHVEVWRNDRPEALFPWDVDVPGSSWRDADAGAAWLLFYRVVNATECGTTLPLPGP